MGAAVPSFLPPKPSGPLRRPREWLAQPFLVVTPRRGSIAAIAPPYRRALVGCVLEREISEIRNVRRSTFLPIFWERAFAVSLFGHRAPASRRVSFSIGWPRRLCGNRAQPAPQGRARQGTPVPLLEEARKGGNFESGQENWMTESRRDVQDVAKISSRFTQYSLLGANLKDLVSLQALGTRDTT